MPIEPALIRYRDSFAEPNPNDSIPTAPAPIAEYAGSSLASASSPPHLPMSTIPIPVPNGDALDTPELGSSRKNAATSNVGATNGASTSDAIDENEGNLDALGRPIPVEDLFVKDAFLVFRALCKLSMKSLVTER